MSVCQAIGYLWRQRRERRLSPEQMELARQGVHRAKPTFGSDLAGCFGIITMEAYHRHANGITVHEECLEPALEEEYPVVAVVRREYTLDGLLKERAESEYRGNGLYALVNLDTYHLPGAWLPEKPAHTEQPDNSFSAS